MEKIEVFQLTDLSARPVDVTTTGGVIQALQLFLTTVRHAAGQEPTVHVLPTLTVEVHTAVGIAEAIRSALVKYYPEQTALLLAAEASQMTLPGA